MKKERKYVFLSAALAIFSMIALTGMSPEEQTYREAGCRPTGLNETGAMSFQCCGMCPDMTIFESYTGSWDAPVTEEPPEPEPVEPQFPIVIAATDFSYNSGWIEDNGWMGTLDNGVNLGTNTVNAPVMIFPVSVISSGDYFLWIKGQGPNASSDSVNYGVDGTRQDNMTFLYGDWSNITQSTNEKAKIFLHSGENNVNIWMREDGTKINEIQITDDGAYTP